MWGDKCFTGYVITGMGARKEYERTEEATDNLKESFRGKKKETGDKREKRITLQGGRGEGGMRVG